MRLIYTLSDLLHVKKQARQALIGSRIDPGWEPIVRINIRILLYDIPIWDLPPRVPPRRMDGILFCASWHVPDYCISLRRITSVARRDPYLFC
jgi:hypothetical protein